MIDLNAYYLKNNKYCALCKYENEDLYHRIECKRIDQDSTNPNKYYKIYMVRTYTEFKLLHHKLKED